MARSGQWVFPGMAGGHRVFSKGAEALSVRFEAGWSDGEMVFNHERPLLIGPKGCEALDTAADALAVHVLDGLAYSGRPTGRAETELHGYLRHRKLFDDWLAQYARAMERAGLAPRPPRRIDGRILDAMSHMESQLNLGHCATEAEVAGRVGLSLSHFKRLFTGHMKVSAKAWLDSRRFERACERLNHGSATVKQVGFELGFRSPNHFSNWFCKRHGSPPGRAFSAGGF